MSLENLIRLSKANNLPIKKSTLYKWSHFGKNPELFIKVNGMVFIDVERLERFLDRHRTEEPI